MSFNPNILGAFVIGGLLTYIVKNKGYFEPESHDAPIVQVASQNAPIVQVASQNAPIIQQLAPKTDKEFSIKAITITNDKKTKEFTYYSTPRTFKDTLNILQSKSIRGGANDGANDRSDDSDSDSSVSDSSDDSDSDSSDSDSSDDKLNATEVVQDFTNFTQQTALQAQNNVLHIGQLIITPDELEVLKTSDLPNGLIILNAQNDIIDLTNVMYITPLHQNTPYMIKIDNDYYQGTGRLPDNLISKITSNNETVTEHKVTSDADGTKAYKSTTINNITVTITNHAQSDTLITNITREQFMITQIHEFKKQMDNFKNQRSNSQPDIQTYLTNILIQKSKFMEYSLGILSELARKSYSGEEIICCKDFPLLWKIELYSTSYMIRLICNSFKNIKDNIHIIIDLTHVKDIFIWNNIKNNITIQINNEDMNRNPKTRRAIVGLGPSGCGKTFVADEVLEALQYVNVCSIDGGFSREHSIAWQLITTSDKMIKDLYKTFTFNNTIHARDIVLDFIRKFDISVYIAETVTGDFISQKLYSSIKISDIDKDWIFLYVWQHLNNSSLFKCTFPKEYKCRGCDVSGKTREKSEGKKYSSNGYPASFKAASAYLRDHNGTKILVHNSGLLKTKNVVWSNNRDILERFNQDKYLRIQSECTHIHKTLTNNKMKFALTETDTYTDVPPTFVIVSHNTRIQCLLNEYEKPTEKTRFMNGCIIKIVIDDNITWTLEYQGEISKGNLRKDELYYSLGQLCRTKNKQRLPSCCIYLIRHTEGTHNTVKFHIYTDTSLTPNGIQQAKNTGNELKKILKTQPDMWFVSDLQRTHQTLNTILKDTKYNNVDFHVLQCSHETINNCTSRGVALENTPNGKKRSKIDDHTINWTFYNETQGKYLCTNRNMLLIATFMYDDLTTNNLAHELQPETKPSGGTRRLKPKRKTRKDFKVNFL